MKFQGERRFDVPVAEVWRALLDPDVLSRTLPGCDGLERVSENRFRGSLNFRVGPVQSQFSGTVDLSDLEPERGFHIRIDGTGPHGFTTAEGAIRLESHAEATTIRYDLDAQVGGRIASVGQRLLDTSARAMVQQALDGLGRQLEALAVAESGAGRVPQVAAATQAEFAAGVAKTVAREQRGVILAVVAALVVLALLVIWLASR